MCEDKKIEKERKKALKQYVKYNFPKFLIVLALCAIIFILIYKLRGENIVSALDGLFYAFMISFIIGLLSIINNFGFFDIFAYNAIRLKEKFLRNKEKSMFYGTYDYTKSKEAKRMANRFGSIAYFLFSLLFLIPLIILFIIFNMSFI